MVPTSPGSSAERIRGRRSSIRKHPFSARGMAEDFEEVRELAPLADLLGGALQPRRRRRGYEVNFGRAPSCVHPPNPDLPTALGPRPYSSSLPVPRLFLGYVVVDASSCRRLFLPVGLDVVARAVVRAAPFPDGRHDGRARDGAQPPSWLPDGLTSRRMSIALL
jgi:hypothetical protein